MNEDIFNIGLFLTFLGFIWMYLDQRKLREVQSVSDNEMANSVKKNLRTIAMTIAGFIIMAIAMFMESFSLV